MGPYRATVLIFFGLAAPAWAQEPGWHYSPIRGEGDRATLGCDRNATEQDYACIAVRCEDDFSVGIYVDTSRPDDTGTWEMTLDRENRSFAAVATDAPYGARIIQGADWLRERIEQGTFIYMRHADDQGGAFRFIDLSGSLYAITSALSFCAPRTPVPSEPTAPGGV